MTSASGAAGWARHVWRREYGFVFLFAVAISCLVVAPVALGPGWPMNHEKLAFVHRMEAVVGQWRQGNLMPVWSSVFHQGMGSPMPGLYHKSFMLLSSVLYAATGGIKVATVGSLLVFCVIGFVGVAVSTMLAFGRACWPAGVVAGTLLLTSNFATTDWLVRGAFAEFSAVMAIAVLLAPLMHLVRRGAWSHWIGVAFALLMLSHMALALFAPPLVLVAIAAASRAHALDWRILGQRMVVGAVIAAVLSMPFLMPLLAFSGYNDTTQLLSEGLHPQSNLIDPLKYLWDPEWKWGERWQGFTVQFDLYVVPVVLGACGLVAWWGLRRAGAAATPLDAGEGSAAGRAIIACLLIGFCLYCVLQLRMALPVYELVPGARYIQFPWRLQAFTTVLSVMLVSSLLVAMWRHGRVASRVLTLVLASAAMAVSLNSSPAVRSMQYPMMEDMRVFQPGETDHVAGGEFGPRPPPGTSLPRHAHLAALFARPLESDCSIEPVGWAQYVETRERHFRVLCERAGAAQLPVFLAPGMAATLDGRTRRSMRRTCTDPRIRIDLPAGTHRIAIELPTWTSLLRSLLGSERVRTRDYC